MAKIFSTIVKNTGSPLPAQLISASLNAVYDNSAINAAPQIKPLLQIRASTLSPGQLQPIQVYKRIERIYTMFNSSPVTQSVQFNNISPTLLSPSGYTRNRPTGLYYGFRSYEPSIPVLPANNFTLLEIKPTANISTTNYETFDEFSSATSGSSAAIRAEPTDVMLQDSQAFPIISGERDVYRVTRFLGSAEGRYFLGLQARMQAGNTFGQSRLYNIGSVRTQAINYRVATLFRPLQRTSRISYNKYTNEEEFWGRVQKETVIKVQTVIRDKYVNGRIKLNRPDALTEYAITAIGNEFRNLAARTRAPRFLNRIVGLPNDASFEQFFNSWDTVTSGIQAIIRSLSEEDPTLLENQTVYDKLYLENLWPVMREYNTIDKVRNFHAEKTAYLERAKQSIAQIKGVQINNINRSTDAYGISDPLNDYRSSVDFTEIVRSAVPVVEFNGVITSRYIKDVTNLANGTGAIVDAKNLEVTDTNNPTDLILLRFVVPSVFDRGINFRAFIEDLNHSSKGQFEDIKYVGRPERFVTYKGMTRNLTFSMYLVAFSENEIETIWTRANMLNKLVYPINSRGGFMVPPITRLTVGNMIVDQPGYVESVDMRFASIPWDIDKELPMAIKLNMNFNIIEKDYITQAGTNPNEFIQLFNQTTKPINYTSATTPVGTATVGAAPGATTTQGQGAGSTTTPPTTPPVESNRQGGYETAGDQEFIYYLRDRGFSVQEICSNTGYLVDESYQIIGRC